MGLLDSMFGAGPEDPRSVGMEGLIAGLLSRNAAGGLLAGSQGIRQARKQQADDARKQQLFDMQLAQHQMQLDEAKRRQAAIEQEAQLQSAIPSLFSGGMSPGAFVPSADGNGPVMPQSAAPPAGFDVQGALRLRMKPDEIAKYAALQNIGRQKVARTVKGMGPDGKEYEYQVDEFGQKVGDGMAQYRAPISVNQGDRTTFADPYSLKPVGQFGMNMSPEGRDSSARGWASLNETKRHNSVSEAGAGAGRAPQGYRFKADGSLEAIPGGPADKQSAATADERKAATLLQRLEGSQKQLEAAINSNPKAQKPELLASGLRSMGSEMLANTVTGTQRQQVDAAQLDLLDAALTLGTGAAYTREQIEGYRKSYFPQIGDDPATVADKRARLENVVQAARIAAGRAANVTSGAKGATGGWGIKKVD